MKLIEDKSRSQQAYGLYKGLVEDNQDPQKRGRVKVRVPAFYGDSTQVSTEELPWALVAMQGASPLAGSFIVPEVGTNVLVMFEAGSVTNPIVIGSFYGYNRQNPVVVKTSTISHDKGRVQKAGENDVPSVGVDDISSRIVYQSPKGSSIICHDENDTECLELKDPNGNVFSMVSPLDESRSKNNSHLKSSAKQSLIAPSQISLSNAFGQGIKIISGGEQGVINIYDESNLHGIEINSKGYIRVFNKKLNGVEFYLDSEKISLRTDKSEIQLNGGDIIIKAQNFNIYTGNESHKVTSSYSVSAGTLSQKSDEADYEASGSLKVLGGSSIMGGSSLTLKGGSNIGAFVIHQGTRVVQCSSSQAGSTGTKPTPEELKPDEQKVWAEPSQVLAIKTVQTTKETSKNLTKVSNSLTSTVSGLEAIKSTIKQSQSLSNSTIEANNYIAELESTKFNIEDSVQLQNKKLFASQVFKPSYGQKQTITLQSLLNGKSVSEVSVNELIDSLAPFPQHQATLCDYLNRLGIQNSDIRKWSDINRQLSSSIYRGSRIITQIDQLITKLSLYNKEVQRLGNEFKSTISNMDTQAEGPNRNSAKNDQIRLIMSAYAFGEILSKDIPNMIQIVKDIGNEGFSVQAVAVISLLTANQSTLNYLDKKVLGITKDILADISILTDAKDKVVNQVSQLNHIWAKKDFNGLLSFLKENVGQEDLDRIGLTTDLLDSLDINSVRRRIYNYIEM